MWGLDIKALRSAVKGAEALIENGAKTCVGELRHYPDRAYEDDEPTSDLNYAVQQGKNAIYNGDWQLALSICRSAFANTRKWKTHYGGEAWKKIAQVLLDIDQAYNDVKEARAARDWDKEIDEMKKCVVLMNVFDGLAHNTGSVMPKLLMEEMGYSSHDTSEYEEEHGRSERAPRPAISGVELSEYKGRVERLMDAKELKSPLAVYKEIEPIIDSSSYRYMFKDWIHKLRQHPEYRKPGAGPEQMRRIRVKKKLLGQFQTMSDAMEKAGKSLRELLAIQPPAQQELFRGSGNSPIFTIKINNAEDLQSQMYYATVAMDQIIDELGTNEMQNFDLLFAARSFKSGSEEMRKQINKWSFGRHPVDLAEIDSAMKQYLRNQKKHMENFLHAINEEFGKGL